MIDFYAAEDVKIVIVTGKSLPEALFLHQLTQNMTTDFSLNYKFST